MEQDDDIIQESPEYTPKSDFSKAEITKECVQKCINARAQEMKAGYWNVKVFPNGVQKEYKPDTRKTYISSVEALRYLLSPEALRHQTFETHEKKLREDMEKLYQKYCYEEMKLEYQQSQVGIRPVWKGTGKKFMPDIDDVVTVPDKMKPGQSQTGQGLWNRYVNTYYDQLVAHYDQLFSMLQQLIDSLNYFGQELVYG